MMRCDAIVLGRNGRKWRCIRDAATMVTSSVQKAKAYPEYAMLKASFCRYHYGLACYALHRNRVFRTVRGTVVRVPDDEVVMSTVIVSPIMPEPKGPGPWCMVMSVRIVHNQELAEMGRIMSL